MTISPATRTWVESLDLDDLSPFDRGRLRVLFAGTDQAEVRRLLGDGSNPGRSATDAYARGEARARGSSDPGFVIERSLPDTPIN